MKLYNAGVYYSDFSPLISGKIPDYALKHLTPERRSDVLASKSAAYRAQTAAGGLLLSAVLSKKHGITDYELEYGEYGKPYLKGRDDLFFNISHSGTFVFCVSAPVPCGIDAEGVSVYESGRADIARKYFSESELTEINSSPYPDGVFTRLWTLKESAAKLVGTGLRDIGRFFFTLDGDSVSCKELPGAVFRELIHEKTLISVCTSEHCDLEYEYIKII